jgi:hypothetical protein
MVQGGVKANRVRLGNHLRDGQFDGLPHILHSAIPRRVENFSPQIPLAALHLGEANLPLKALGSFNHSDATLLMVCFFYFTFAHAPYGQWHCRRRVWGKLMEKRDDWSARKKKPQSETTESISQIFKVDQPTYLRVRTLAAARRGTGKAATGQDIYAEAIQEYLARHTVELMDVA